VSCVVGLFALRVPSNSTDEGRLAAGALYAHAARDTYRSLTHEEHACTQYNTQAQGFPDGPKEAAHYYTLIQPYDDFGQPSMPEFYPDAALGVPEVCLSAFSFFLPPPPPPSPLLGTCKEGARKGVSEEALATG
jgi:hypothetical protein